MKLSCTSKLHIPVVLCITRHSSGLCDMNCYSMNGSHTSQGGIPMGGMSQIKTEHFSFTLASAPPSMSLLHQYSFLPKHHPVPGTQLISTQKGGSLAWGGSACSLSPNTGILGCYEHEGAVHTFDWWTVCQELIETDQRFPQMLMSLQWGWEQKPGETWQVERHCQGAVNVAEMEPWIALGTHIIKESRKLEGISEDAEL